jgi:hypothetical protein
VFRRHCCNPAVPNGVPRASLESADTRLAAAMLGVAQTDLNQARAGLAAAGAAALAVVGLDVGAAAGLAAIAAARVWPHGWWYPLPVWAGSMVVALSVFFFRAAESASPVLGPVYAYARAALPNEQSAYERAADLLLYQADVTLAAASRRRYALLGAIALLGVGIAYLVVRFHQDFK